MDVSPTPRTSSTQGTPAPGATSVAGVLREPRVRLFAGLVLVATVGLLPGWLQLIKSAAADDLHSYAALIPLICVWLAWPSRYVPLNQSSSTAPLRGRATTAALVLGLAALAAGTASYLGRAAGRFEHETSWLATQLLPWVLAVWAAALASFDPSALRQRLFPLAFLVFTIPFPEPMVQAIEQGLQHASASVVEWAFRLLSVSYVRDERNFWVPGLRFEVAQECSGVRSTVVLFITSLIGGHLLLKSPWRQGVLALSVIPLGILRNTFRICTITLLSANVDPTIIHSALHHRGGPVFFALSLIPFFLLLWWLRRQECPKVSAPNPSRAL
ncbi:MAG: archaeosortase/exosortase family protein [Verrucomicrobiales bacterium]|nr:archaeosortase/exosortase family protein [Verrucomicrobiales bacterium]